MQIILFQNVERLGMQGDVVSVATGYFRNYLGPRGIAVEATESNMSRLEAKRKRLRATAELQLNEAGTVAARLSQLEVRFVMKAIDEKKLFGSVQDHDIVERIKAEGFEIERRQVVLKEPLKTLGEHQVKINMLGHVEAQVKVIIEPEGGVPAAAAPTPATEEPAAPVAEEPTPAAPATEDPS